MAEAQPPTTETHDKRPAARPSRSNAGLKDAAAEAVPDDSTSMSVPPPSRDARRSSEAVGSPQAAAKHVGPSPPNKTSDQPAPPTAPAWASSVAAEPKGTPAPPHARTVAETHPAKETLKALEGPRAGHQFVQGVHGVRYQVEDVARSVAFYTQQLGFTLRHQQLPAFASVSLGDTQLLLSGPQASGSRPMPDGRRQGPGGWNRVVLRVHDLPAFVGVLESAGMRFRNTMETGPGGRQVQVEDPDGNPIELFEPAR